MSAVRTARGPRGRYSDLHPDSPIALAFDTVGPVKVPDSVRADVIHAVGREDWRRAYGLGVVSLTEGSLPDVHQHASGLWLELVNPADYLVMWIDTACRWQTSGGTNVIEASDAANADRGEVFDAERLAQIDRWAAELVQVAPVWYLDWLSRLVHRPKWVYLVELGAAQWLAAGAPETPAAEWADKVARQWVARARGADQVARVVEVLEQF